MKQGHLAMAVGILALGCWLVASRAQERPIGSPQTFQGESGQQVVLETVHTKDGYLWVRAKTPSYFRLVPRNGQDHYAPLPPHTLMLCRELTYKGDLGESHVSFLCGSDNYTLESLGFSDSSVEGDAEPRNPHRNLGRPAGN